jgi:hypothetical protein
VSARRTGLFQHRVVGASAAPSGAITVAQKVANRKRDQLRVGDE